MIFQVEISMISILAWISTDKISTYPAKMGHGPHSSQLVNCIVLCIVCVDCVVLCIVYVQMCAVLLPPSVNPIAVNK